MFLNDNLLAHALFVVDMYPSLQVSQIYFTSWHSVQPLMLSVQLAAEENTIIFVCIRRL